MSGLNDFGEFFFGGWPGGPYRLGSLKWGAMTFAVLFGFVFLLLLLFAPIGRAALMSALIAALSTAIIWLNVLYLRHRKRAPLSPDHRLRDKRRANR